MSEIKLISISELLGMNFFIPSYQRGYRWQKQQVKDLLDDIQEFIYNYKETGGFYCIQPLVVKEQKKEQETLKLIKEANDLDEIKKLLKESWEVIDGQQRLTTIYILLSCLEIPNLYTIKYKTRPDSEEFLKKIDEKKKEDNIDYYHIVEANEQISDWLNPKTDVQKKEFTDILLNNIKFIWYKPDDKNPIKTFTRLNIGKISLTNAELIKALFLNKSNFKNTDDKIRFQQRERASEWDTIEYTLQNDEFWLFLKQPEYDKPTRIDFIFDLICDEDKLNLKKNDLGTDEYKTFRYFYAWFEKNKKDENKIKDCWQKVKEIFQIFQEWFNDLELYHYIGYLLGSVLSQKISKLTIPDIIREWQKEEATKDKFISNYIIPKITKTLSKCKDLDKQYSDKTDCRPILLLHNIQTVIHQNQKLKENEKYKLPIFYKFPFHLFKKEKWDVEHIDSHSENSLDEEKEQKEWLECSLDFVNDDLKEEIKNFLYHTDKNGEQEFEALHSKITSTDSDKLRDEGGNTINEKDMLWNFTLLDSSTNKGNGNAIFPAKRRSIIDKDQGKNKEIAFIPPCTKNVFLKYYNPTTANLREWDRDDATKYLDNIRFTLEDFLNERGK